MTIEEAERITGGLDLWGQSENFTPPNKDKDLSRSMATRLYPKNAEQFKRKKDDGRAEATLIAHWARGKYT